MTTKERLLFYWTKEAESRLKEWQMYQTSGNKTLAEQAKERYISARKTLEEIGG